MDSSLRQTRGFTLIEVMIVVGLIAILSAVAFPSYADYVIRGNVPEATSTLSSLQVRMEQFFQDNRAYRAAGANTVCANIATANTRNFTFDCPVLTDTTFQLRARGTAGTRMNGFTYTLDQNSVRTSTIAAPAPAGWQGTQNNCWIVKKGSLC